MHRTLPGLAVAVRQGVRVLTLLVIPAITAIHTTFRTHRIEAKRKGLG